MLYLCRVPKHQQTQSGSKVVPIYDLGRYSSFTAVPRRVIWDSKSRVPVNFPSSNALISTLHATCTPNIQHIKATFYQIKYNSIIHTFKLTHKQIAESRHTSWQLAQSVTPLLPAPIDHGSCKGASAPLRRERGITLRR